MEISEKELEDLIFNTDNENLIDRGLYIYGKKKRQVNIGNYGICDLISYHKTDDMIPNSPLNINIIELKKGKIDFNALNQIIRYAQGIKDYLEIREFNNYIFTLTLIGNELDLNNDLFAYLPNLVHGLEYTNGSIFSIDYYKYSLRWDGIYFDECKGYSLTNTGF